MVSNIAEENFKREEQRLLDIENEKERIRLLKKQQRE